MYDSIQGLGQVKCFKCNLDYYPLGSIIPCEENNLPKDLVVLSIELSEPEATDCWDWRNGHIAIIKNSVFEKYLTTKDIDYNNDELFKDLQVINSRGKKIKIFTPKDLFDYIKDNLIHEKKCEIIDIEYEKWNREEFPEFECENKKDKLYEIIADKWFIKDNS